MVLTMRYAAGYPWLGQPMQIGQLKRREFITLLGGATAWPLAVSAQQAERMRRIGVLMGYAETDAQPQVAALRQELQKLGWEDEQHVMQSRSIQRSGQPTSASACLNARF